MSTAIKILGTGCPKCKQTAAMVNEVVAENKIDATVEKVEDIMEIMKYDIMSTPALVINEKVVIKGRVPAKDEILALLNNTNATNDAASESCCAPGKCC